VDHRFVHSSFMAVDHRFVHSSFMAVDHRFLALINSM